MDAKQGENRWFGLLPTHEASRLSGAEFLQGSIEGVYPEPPFMEISGVRLISAAGGRSVLEATPSARFYNPLGIVHGGWAALVLDTVMGSAMFSMLPKGQSAVTIDMNTSYIRAIREEMGPLRGEGVVLHAGSRVIRAEGRLFDSKGRLLVYATENAMVTEIAEMRQD